MSEGNAEPIRYTLLSKQVVNFTTYLALFLLYLTPRLFQTGHILAWDEAWNLCALRSLAEGNSIFTFQYWRHPPLYMELGRLLQPMSPGFAIRMEVMSVLLSGAAMLGTVCLIKGVLDRRTAVYTGIVWALMPGAIFFETWVKRDPVVALFGMLAWLLLFKNKYLPAGLCLGLAFLGKETAIFYVPALALSVIVFRVPKPLKALFWLAVGPLVMAGWWYLFMAAGEGGFVSFFMGNSLEARSFAHPGWYYFEKLILFLGWPGFILFFLGSCSALSCCRWSKKTINNDYLQAVPLLFLLPALTVISLSVGKPAWMLIPLIPSLAILCGQGWRRVSSFLPVSFSYAILVLFMFVALSGFNYNHFFKTLSPDQFWHAEVSLSTGAMINENVKDNERLLVLPMLYRDGPEMFDPITYWELRTGISVVRTLELQITSRQLVNFTKHKKIDWILMSPIDGSDQWSVFTELFDEHKQVAYVNEGVVLFETKSIWDGKVVR